jgi:hypothetical protein
LIIKYLIKISHFSGDKLDFSKKKSQHQAITYVKQLLEDYDPFTYESEDGLNFIDVFQRQMKKKENKSLDPPPEARISDFIVGYIKKDSEGEDWKSVYKK